MSWRFAPSAEREIRAHLERAERERAFDERWHNARANVSGTMVAGERVVAARVGLSFYDGTVVSVTGTTVRVRWAGQDRWPERDVPKRHVGRVTTTTPTDGQLVLWRRGAETGRWNTARFVKRADDKTFVVEGRDGKSHKVTDVDFVLFDADS